MEIFRKYTILVVDDDISIIKFILSILIKNPEYVVLTTCNGKSACEIAKAASPDLILMDWQMPIMNGIDATLQLNKDDMTKDIPIIILTGAMINSADLSTALVSGAVDYLRKPIDDVELLARVSNMLRLSVAYLEIKKNNVELQSHLATKLVNIQQLNELKNATIKQFAIIKEQATAAENQLIKSSIIQAERLLYSKINQVNWDDFESHFEFIHEGFFKKLRATFNNLTPNELRLCAFIRLNLCNKEIAQIIFTTPDSVNTARKRLKKKFGLLPSQGLQSFIRNL